MRLCACGQPAAKSQPLCRGCRSRLRSPGKTLLCVDCGAPHGRGPAAKRCPPCAEIRRKTVISQWGKNHPDKVGAAVAGYRERNPERAAAARRRAERKYAQANPEKRALVRHRRRARLRDACSPGVTAAEWSAICARYERNGVVRCAYCEDPATSVDHVIPIKRGGRDEPDNVTPACRSCNSSKGAKLLSEWRGRRKAAA